MSEDDFFRLVCGAIGLATLTGIVLAARGRVFGKPADAPAGPYRTPMLTPTQTATPPRVRSVGVASVVFGVGTSFVLAPAGALGAMMDADRGDSFTRSMSQVLAGAVVTGFVAGIALAIAGVRVSRGRGLKAAPWIALGWGVHHALVALYFFGWAGHYLDEAGFRRDDAASFLVGALLVLVLGAVPAMMLRWAAREMRTIVPEVSATEESG